MFRKVVSFFKKNILGIIIGGVIFGSVSVLAATYFPSNQVTYDNGTSGLSSNNVQGAIDELYNECFPPTQSVSDKIINLLPNKPNELYKDEHGDIRYYGANPNNYVSFNNELWRIIGVIDGKMKIVKYISIGEKQYGDSRSNSNWNESVIKAFLNDTYHNSIYVTYRIMISEETYYLGGPPYDNYLQLKASGWYSAERSNNVYNNNPTTVKQYIGLMYPSDYGYASGSSCLSTSLSEYYTSCANSNYLFIDLQDDLGAQYNDQWLQTPVSDDGCVSYLAKNGNVFVMCRLDNYYIPQPVVLPTLYLKSNVQIVSGDGSQDDPYQLSL